MELAITSLNFLEDLGFKSSSDKLIIGVLKVLDLLDDSSQPTQRYYEFLDQSQSKRVIAKGIQEAYEDLFNLRVDAQNMTNEDIKNKLRTLTQGQKGDRVIELMATVYTAIAAFENMVRAFVVKILIENKDENWWVDSLINYTEFGDLASIMQQNISFFEDHIISIDWARLALVFLVRPIGIVGTGRYT